MRTLTLIVAATVLGLSSTAFAAEPTARENRMNEARKNFEAQKAGTPVQAKATPATKKQATARKKHIAKKAHATKKGSAKKQQARSGNAAGTSVKSTPAAVK